MLKLIKNPEKPWLKPEGKSIIRYFINRSTLVEKEDEKDVHNIKSGE